MVRMVPLTPQAFAQRWGESTLPERSSYQQHFLDLCEMLGAPKPADIDPTGDFFTFEKGVEKTGGGMGFADVWYRDLSVAWCRWRPLDLRNLREAARLDWGSVESAIFGTHYNARPTWLANAHAELDEPVFEAYVWPRDISDEDILKNLLALNLERSGDAGD
jgi:hypothetical protein